MSRRLSGPRLPTRWSAATRPSQHPLQHPRPSREHENQNSFMCHDPPQETLQRLNVPPRPSDINVDQESLGLLWEMRPFSGNRRCL
jgi:hypothetical protein